MMLGLLGLLLLAQPIDAPVQAAPAATVAAGDLTLSRVVLLDRIGRDGPVSEVIILVRNTGATDDELLSATSTLGLNPALRVDATSGSRGRATITRTSPYPIPTQASLGERGQAIISLSFATDAKAFPEGAPVTLRFARAGEVTVTALPPPRRGL